jgi:TRAP-type uncharacterized transport system fused permease subunit
LHEPGVSDDRSHGLTWGAGAPGYVLFTIALVFSVFQLWTAAFSPLPSQIVRAVHVGFLLLVCFGLFANQWPLAQPRFWLYWALAAAAFLTGLYHWWEYEPLILRSGDPNRTDIASGSQRWRWCFWALGESWAWPCRSSPACSCFMPCSGSTCPRP